MHEEQADEGGLPHRQEQEQQELQVAGDGQLERERQLCGRENRQVHPDQDVVGTLVCGLHCPSDQVDDGEQDDPHQIDEVPVQADRLDTRIVPLGVLTRQRLREIQVCHRDHAARSEEHTSELQSLAYLVCRLL